MSTIANVNKFHLLLIEDNEADIDLLRFLISSSKTSISLHSVKDGAEASEFLFKTGKYEKETTVPDLVLMDLNIPRIEGRTLLRQIKAHPKLCKLPVVILSTSSSDQEVEDCYSLGASAFISKPLQLNEFQDMVNVLVKFYFGTVRLSTRPGKL